MCLEFSVFFFCFKQKTAYEMRISDWSSDVCSSDLIGEDRIGGILVVPHALRLAIGLDERDLIVAAAGEAHVIDRLGIDPAEAAGRAIFGRHVPDRRAIRQRQLVQDGAVQFDETADDALLERGIAAWRERECTYV